MRKVVVKSFFVSLLVLALTAQQAVAHGTHNWFVSPEQDASVRDRVTFEVEAPYARNHYIHLSVTREGETKPTWQELLELHDKTYSTRVDIQDWAKGKYRAEAILLGALFQHPVRTSVVIQ